MGVAGRENVLASELGLKRSSLFFMDPLEPNPAKFHNVKGSDGPFSHHLFTKESEMPAKGYVPQPGRAPGMPERPHAKNFNRRLDPAEAQILTCAGNGSKTDGFRNLLGLYQELHNLGFRFDMDLNDFLASSK